MQQPFVQPQHPQHSAPASYEMPSNSGAFGHPPAMYPSAAVFHGYPGQPPHVLQNAYPQAMPVPMQHAGQQADMHQVKETLDGLANQLNSLAQMQHSARHEPLVADPYRGNMAAPFAQADAGVDIKNLSGAIVELQSAIAGIKAHPAPTSDLTDLKNGIAQIREDISSRVVADLNNRIDPSAYAEAVEKSHKDILGQIREIQTTVERNANGPQVLADTLHARQNDVVSRLDEISASLEKLDDTGDPEEAIAMREQLARLDVNVQELAENSQTRPDSSGFGERLDEITRGILALSAPSSNIDNLERIEARMMGLARDLKESSEKSQTISPAFDPKALEPYFAQTLSTLKAFEDRMDGVENGRSSGPAFEKLAADIEGLSERVSNLSVAASPTGDGSSLAAQPALLERLDALVHRVEDLQSGNKPFENTTLQFGSLEQQISEISDQLDAMASTSTESPAILERLDSLVDRVDHLCNAGTASDASGLVNALQKQIASITANLGGVSEIGGDLPLLNQRLDGIEKQLGASRDIGIEVAAGAAEEAVRKVISEMPATGSNLDRETVQALLDDIRKLVESGSLAASGDGSEMTALKTALDSISNRLEVIEGGLEKIGSQPTVAQAAVNTAAPAIVPTHMPGVHSGETVSPVSTQPAEPAPAIANVEEAAGAVNKTSAGEVLVRAAREAEQERQRAKKGYEESFAGAVDKGFARDLDAELPNSQPGTEELEQSQMPEVVAPRLSFEELPEGFSGGRSPDDVPAIASDGSGSNDVPIEPGSGGPDLTALVRQANDRRKALSDKGEGTSGTDFLAAARRAAQAAALEASEVESREEETSKSPSFLSSLPGLFSKNKKAVVIAAAAILLVAVAVPIISNFSDGFGNAELAQSSNNNESETLGQTSNNLASSNTDNSHMATSNLPAVEPVTAAPDETWENATEGTDSSILITPVEAASYEAGNSLPVSAASIEIDVSKAGFASKALRDAVTANDPFAMFEIAKRYTNGAGTSKNMDEAALWYEKSASLGVVPAQYVIGNFYEKGIGVTADRTIARAWYEQAAIHGHVISMHNLGVMSASPNPETGEINFNEAIKWFRKAADYGVRDSQVNLGIFLAKGSGGEVDLIEAYKWFSLASQSGDSDATDKRDFVANALRPDQLIEAKSRVEAWVVKTPDPKVNDVSIPDSWKSNAAIAVLDDRKSIAKTQSLLTKIGFNIGPADGVLGKKTRQAIVDFRTRAGLPVRDRVDTELLDALIAVAI